MHLMGEEGEKDVCLHVCVCWLRPISGTAKGAMGLVCTATRHVGMCAA